MRLPVGTPPLVISAVLGLSLLTGCPSRESVGVGSLSILGAGVVNSPSNKSLRFDILKFGLDRFCEEMRKGGAPLKLADDQPVIGRFFASACQAQVIEQGDRQSFVVQFEGRGYAYSQPTGRLGFNLRGLVEYAADFQLEGEAMYVYFRPRLVDATAFQTLMVESQLAQTAMQAVAINPDEFGKRVVDGQLKRGFTVIRWSEKGETEFGMGIIAKGERPFRPFDVKTEDKLVVANDRTEVHSGQQDFIGAFTVPEDDQAFYLTLATDGAPLVDVLLVPKVVGDGLVDSYVKNRGPVSIPGGARLDESVPQGTLFQRFVNVPPGEYYLVLDNSDRAGHSAPPSGKFDDRAAKVDYLVLRGDKP
jgi:hypothetical protein